MANYHEQSPRPDQQPEKPLTLKKFEYKWNQDKFACVGLDSKYSMIPYFLKEGRSVGEAMWNFNNKIAKSTHDIAGSYKLNIAFYEAEGSQGMFALGNTIYDIRDMDPSMPVIVDAKRADVENTSREYAKLLFKDLVADAVTLSPYMGSSLIQGGERKLGSLEPFLSQKDKMSFVLCRTSNDDAGEFQDLPIALNELSNDYKRKFGNLGDLSEKIGSNVAPLYLVLAHKLARDWNVNGNVGLVVSPSEIGEVRLIRKVIGDMPILVPGVGVQGRGMLNVVRGGVDNKNQGFFINSSRQVIFSSENEDFAEAARDEVVKLTNTINSIRFAA